jgi:hypothetical protein
MATQINKDGTSMRIPFGITIMKDAVVHPPNAAWALIIADQQGKVVKAREQQNFQK